MIRTYGNRLASQAHNIVNAILGLAIGVVWTLIIIEAIRGCSSVVDNRERKPRPPRVALAVEPVRPGAGTSSVVLSTFAANFTKLDRGIEGWRFAPQMTLSRSLLRYDELKTKTVIDVYQERAASNLQKLRKAQDYNAKILNAAMHGHTVPQEENYQAILRAARQRQLYPSAFQRP